jgi:hypothetical protein
MEPSSNPLDAILAAYLEAVERGERPDREALLRAHPQHAAALRAFFADLDTVPRAPAAPPLPAARTVLAGRYKLIESIGEGGMGEVWMAEQIQPLRRKVAIKLVKPGMDSRQVLARFDAERQALAVMDHPNIAKVFDGGLTEQGHPFFVMEYVKGIPIHEFCDRERLSLNERLALFLPVCEAVQHAHHKGIVHRDLKPSNILVCLYDGRPVPKVIDFGLAKALHQPLTELSLHTGHGVVVGTLLYMSPEQAEHNNLDVDTRTDVYSLGVLLYELLTGSTPLEKQRVEAAAFAEIVRAIKEEEPPRPSVRLSGSNRLPSIAAQRRLEPARLQRTLAGDLDWIVMKALEKERSRRYETANSFARDIERFLNDEAVEARPPSAGYRLRRMIRRHRGRAAAVAAVLMAMVVAVVGMTWAYTSERDKREGIERAQIAGILRPIGYGDDLAGSELHALADWSELPEPQLKLAVLAAAFEDPATALRVARRADHVLQACVGLSFSRREAILRLLTTKQLDDQADPRIRVAACWLALALAGVEMPALAESFAYLSNPENRMTNLCGEFVALAPRLAREQVVRIWDVLVAGLENTDDSDALSVAGASFSAMATQLDPDQASRSWDLLAAVLKKTKDSEALSAAAIGLAALAIRLAPEDAARSWDVLAGMLDKPSDWNALSAAGTALAALAPRLEPEQAAPRWDALATLLVTSRDVDALRAAEKGLAALTPRLAPEQAPPRWDVVAAVLENTEESDAVGSVGACLTALAPQLAPEQASRRWDPLIAVMERKGTAELPGDAMFWAFVRRLELECAATAGLAALAPQLPSDQVAPGVEALARVLPKTTDYRARSAEGQGLAVLTRRLRSEQVAWAWDALIQNDSPGAFGAAGEGLAALAPRLAAEQAARGWDAVIGILERSVDDDSLLESARKVLVALSPRLAPEELGRRWDATVAALAQDRHEPNVLSREILSALAPCLEDQRAARADALLLVLEESSGGCEAAEHALAVLAPRLAPAQAAQCWNVWVRKLGDLSADDAFAALAARLPEDQVVRSWAELARMLNLSGERLRQVGEGLLGLLPRVSADRSGPLMEPLMVALAPFRREEGERIAGAILRLAPDRRTSVSRNAVTVFLDFAASSESYFYGGGQKNYDAIRTCARAVNDPRVLARCLAHPACTGEIREWLLQRFEELLFHDGKDVFLKPPSEDVRATPAPESPPPARRFRSLHDAADWIAHNWPEFDLEAAAPFTWRGDR